MKQDFIALCMGTKILFIAGTLLLITVTAKAQKLYVVPGAGIQMLRAKNTLDEYTTGKLLNNRFYLAVLASGGIEYEFSDKSTVSLYYQNSHDGISMGVRDRNTCDARLTGYTIWAGHAYSYDNHRFLVMYKTKPFKKHSTKKAHININLQVGIGLDKKQEFNQGRILFPHVNSCGEEFVLEDTGIVRRNIGLVLPLQVNFELHTKRKRSVALTLFYYFGLTPHFTAGVDYVTDTGKREKARFTNYGTTYGTKLSYPIRLIDFNKRKQK
jgi:hypothetical protein